MANYNVPLRPNILSPDEPNPYDVAVGSTASQSCEKNTAGPPRSESDWKTPAAGFEAGLDCRRKLEPIHLPQRQTANESKGKLHDLVQRWTRRRQASDFGQPLQEYDGSWGEFQKCTCGGNGERRRTGRYRSLIRRFTNQGQSQSSIPSFYSNAWESLPTSRYLVELEGDSDFHGFGGRVELPAQPISPQRRSCQQSQPDTPRPETPLQSVSGQPACFGTLSSSRPRVERTFEGVSLRPANCPSKLTAPFDPSLPLSLLPPIDVEIYKLFEDSDGLNEDSSSYSPVSWEHADGKTFGEVKVTCAGNFGQKSSLPSQSVKPTDHSDNNFKSYVTEEQPQNASEIHYLDEVSRSHSPASWKYDDDENFEVAKKNTWSGSTNVLNSTVNLGTNFQLKANKRQKKGHFVGDSAPRLQSPAATTPRRNYRMDFSSGLNLSGSSQVSGVTSPSFSPRSLSERDPGCLDRSSEAETASSLGSHVTSDSSAYSGSFSTSGELTYEGKRRLLLGQLMREVYSIISPRLPSPPVNQLGNEDSTNARWKPSSGTTVKATTSSNSGSSGREKYKRLPDDPDSGRSGGGEGQKRARMDIPDEEGTARLACPYFKRHPQRYCTSKWRSCPGPGWNTVHRVKEHIYRCHALPITCPRCHEQFHDAGSRDAHLMAEERCQIRERPALDGFSPETEKQLRSRKKGSKHLTEADKWRDVYLILFPDTALEQIPSPYLEFGSGANTGDPDSAFERYDQYLRQELPSRVRKELESKIDKALAPLEESLKSQIVSIIRDVQLELFESFVSEPANPFKAQEQMCYMDESASRAGKKPVYNTNEWLEGELEAFKPTPYLEENVEDLILNWSPGKYVYPEAPEDDGLFSMAGFNGGPSSAQQSASANLQLFSSRGEDSAYASLSSGSYFNPYSASRAHK